MCALRSSIGLLTSRAVFPVLLAISAGALSGQIPGNALNCEISAVPPVVRLEGVAERMGDILIRCNNGLPNGSVTGNLAVFLTVDVANRLSPQNTLDIVLTTDIGGGQVIGNAAATLLNSNTVLFNGLTIPISAQGTVTVRITNLRGAAVQVMSPQIPERTISATLAFNPNSLLHFSNTFLTVAVPRTGLLSSSASTAIVCVGSPLPETLDLPSLFDQGTRFSSTRITEGHPEAFEPRQPMSDQGIRFMVRYSGFPAGARLFVPDAIAGSSALEPTAAGDLGTARSGGRYQASAAGSLLLARVINTDTNGGGGLLTFTAPQLGSDPVSFSAVSEVPLVNGAGVAVYEVVDANRVVVESAQIPTFLGIPPPAGGPPVIANASVTFAPQSLPTTLVSPTAPIPRFVNVPPPSDCQLLRDCNAQHFPSLLVDSPALTFTARAGSAFQVRYLRVNNQGGSVMSWTARLTYRNGADWIRIDTPFGINNATIRLDVLPEKLAPGVYEATLTIDAGSIAGSRALPVRLEVSPAVIEPPTPPPQPTAVVSAVTNAATMVETPLAPGSLATLFGTRLAGREVQVTLDEFAARVLHSAEGQINLEVPEQLAGRTSAMLTVRVDGVAGQAVRVRIAPASPGLFGVLNQDNSLNAASNPALAGSVLQVFATGLIAPGATRVEARLHDRDVTPVFAGAAPGLRGVQQANIAIPDDLPAMTTELRLCSVTQAGERFCSAPMLITIRR